MYMYVISMYVLCVDIHRYVIRQLDNYEGCLGRQLMSDCLDSFLLTKDGSVSLTANYCKEQTSVHFATCCANTP